jgi:hypothetical protein
MFTNEMYAKIANKTATAIFGENQFPLDYTVTHLEDHNSDYLRKTTFRKNFYPANLVCDFIVEFEERNFTEPQKELYVHFCCFFETKEGKKIVAKIFEVYSTENRTPLQLENLMITAFLRFTLENPTLFDPLRRDFSLALTADDTEF